MTGIPPIPPRTNGPPPLNRKAAYEALVAYVLSPARSAEADKVHLDNAYLFLSDRRLPPQLRAQLRLQRAAIFQKAGDYITALKEIRMIGKIVRDLPDCLFQLWHHVFITSLSQACNNAQAQLPDYIQELSLIISNRRRVPERNLFSAYAFRALGFIASGNAERALEDYQKALELEFSPRPTLYYHAVTNYIILLGKEENMSDLPEMIRILSAALATPEIPTECRIDLSSLRAEVYLRTKDYSNALNDLNAVLSDDHCRILIRLASHLDRGTALFCQGRLAEAMVEYYVVLTHPESTPPQIAGASHDLGMCKLLSGKLEEAEMRLRCALDAKEGERGPTGKKMSRCGLAIALFHLGRLDESREHWQDISKEKDFFLQTFRQSVPNIVELFEKMLAAFSEGEKSDEPTPPPPPSPSPVPAPAPPLPALPKIVRITREPDVPQAPAPSPPPPPAQRGGNRIISTNSGATITINKSGAQIEITCQVPGEKDRTTTLSISRSGKKCASTIDPRKIFNQPNDGAVLAHLRRITPEGFIPR